MTVLELFERHPEVFGQSVSAIFQLERERLMCIQMENNLIFGFQYAIEHGDAELFLGTTDELQAMFSERDLRITHPMEFIIRGRRFRAVGLGDDGGFVLDFGRYRIKCERSSQLAKLEFRRDYHNYCELPEDYIVGPEEQLAQAAQKFQAANRTR